jgi:hypothetical protein
MKLHIRNMATVSSFQVIDARMMLEDLKYGKFMM